MTSDLNKSFDFNKVPDRRRSGSYKWDSVQGDVIPLWVADMDFEAAPPIMEALRRRVDHGVFGYVKVPDAYYEALTSWFDRRHHWHIEPKTVIYTSGVVPAISAIIKALCTPGDGVILQTPAYNCFFSSIRNNGCNVIENPLKRIQTPGGFSYEIDFEDLERKAADPTNTLLLLCNPHNPTGRIWKRSELQRLAEICRRHSVTVVSDEIHCELTLPESEYVPYAIVDPQAVVCCSPSKAFNIAGLQIANIVVPNPYERALIDRAINVNEVCDVNPFGVVALMAAYNEGEPWLHALREYIADNYRFLRRFFRENLRQLPVCDLEATYLVWVDIAPLGIPSEEFEQKALADGVYVNPGLMYGAEGFIRINIACPRERLAEGLRRLAKTVKKY